MKNLHCKIRADFEFESAEFGRMEAEFCPERASAPHSEPEIIKLLKFGLRTTVGYTFCKICIHPPGEPREQHQGDVRPTKFELHKI